jgi:hypothetical protein
MADYQPLIARAVAGLDNNTGENRRALYERARTALVAQLRSVEPALEETEITRERLALEEAIRKVEADAVRRAMPEEPAKAPAEEAPSLRDQALRNFRETMAEAEGHDEPPASAAHEKPAPRHYFEPPASEPEEEPEPSPYAPHHGAHPAPSYEAPADEEPAEPLPRAVMHEPMPEEPLPESWPPAPAAQYDDDDIYTRPARNWGRIAMIAAIVLAVIGVAGAVYWQRGAISSMFASMRSSTPAPKPPPQQATQPTGQPKIADRIGGDQAGTANAPAAAVAQKVVLYDEDPNDPQGKRYVGSAIWRTETVSPGPGLAPELAIRADVEIPERRMRMTWSLRRNTDKALPASHTIEIMFTLPADFAEGGIGNVPGVLMKQNEQARGVPLAGLAVKVTNGYFLIGLSAVDIDLQRNVQLLKERDWFDIPIVYTSGKRAILAVEKGTPGSRAFEEAFRAWGQ